MSEKMKTMQNIIKEIIGQEVELTGNEFLREASGENEAVTLGLSSIDIVDLVTQLEIEFDVDFEEEKIASLKTVNDVIKFIENVK
ncbi:MAG: phosphopantetheine-binding protein [Clostridia bacterium]|nr:phosphopantetheine-binding protein [Clostridia bacterium]